MRETQKPRITRHVVGWWIATPVAATTIMVFINRSIGAPQTEINTWIIVCLSLGLLVGPLVGLFFWILSFGLYGFRTIISGGRKAFDEGVVEGNHDIIEGQKVTLDTAGQDPWHGQNPYGCCINNTDAEGHPAHGAAGCKHPRANLLSQSDR